MFASYMGPGRPPYGGATGGGSGGVWSEVSLGIMQVCKEKWWVHLEALFDQFYSRPIS